MIGRDLRPPPLRFAGYAAIFGREDRGGDVVERGAFAHSLARQRQVPLLWQHRDGQAVGRIDHIAEDQRGLRVVATITAATAAAMVKCGATRGLSFGYRVRVAEGQRPRRLITLDLIEISLVTCPMQPLARILAAEAA